MNNNIDVLTIGEKVRTLRRRAKISQFELEMQLGAAPGSMSRIESGHVNPSKETLLHIGQALQLRELEIAYLLNVRTLYPTQTAINNGVAEAKDYLDRSDVIAFLIDEGASIYYLSKGFIKLFSLDQSHVMNIIGKNMLEIAFNPDLGVQQYIDTEKSRRVLAIEYKRLSSESHIADENLQELATKYLLAKEVGEIARAVSQDEVFSITNKQAFFKLDSGNVKFTYGRERLKKNRRFEIIEFVNPEVYA